ncbi:VanZ family protein [bacterium]|nr:VanZ family protein [bacterium]
MELQKREIFFWSLFCLYGLFIILTLPYIVPIQRAIGSELQDILLPFVIITITIVFLLLVAYIFCIKRERRIKKYLGLLFGSSFILISVDILILRTSYPSALKAVEFIHFFEYGILSFFTYLSLRYRIKTRLVFIYSALIISIFGFVDEGIQWIIPSRVGELKDVLTNVFCAVAFQIFISQVVEPINGFKKIRMEDYKGLLKAFSALFFVTTIFVFFVNTGFLIFDEKLGYFRSKFSKEDLLYIKEERELLNSKKPTDKASKPIVVKPDTDIRSNVYNKGADSHFFPEIGSTLLNILNSPWHEYWCIDDFFAQEAKFHIKKRNDLLHGKHFRDAYFEEKILEKYYLPIMKALNQNLPESKVKEIFYKIPDRQNRYYYHSPIRENIMTGRTKVIVLFLLITLSITPLFLDILTDK